MRQPCEFGFSLQAYPAEEAKTARSRTGKRAVDRRAAPAPAAALINGSDTRDAAPSVLAWSPSLGGGRIRRSLAGFEGEEDKPRRQQWVDEFASAIRQSDHGAYVNFVGDEGEQRIHEIYPGATFARLAEVKRRYDPTNLFRLNQNIPPA